MTELDPKPLLGFEAGFDWWNKHESVNAKVERLYAAWNRTAAGLEPATQRWRAGLNVLRQIVIDAEAAGKRVRAYGGAWSLSDAALTPDYLVNTKPLNYLSQGFEPAHVTTSAQPLASRLVYAQCGVHVMELNSALEAAGWALPTSGASNGQTIAGAVSTGTHGSAIDVGSMQDYVRALHIVGEGGEHFVVQPSSRPTVTKAFCDFLGATLLEDDDMFHAALVSFGSFGLIHGLILLPVPMFLLEKKIIHLDFDEARAGFDLAFEKLGLGPERPHHFEMVLNPYQLDPKQGGAWIVAMYKRTPGQAIPDADVRSSIEPGDDAMWAVGGLTNAVPALVPGLVTTLVGAPYAPTKKNVVATPGVMFGSTSIRGPIGSAEIGVPLAHAERAAEKIARLAENERFAGVVACRFVRSSNALLAFTRFAPTTCTIELPGVASPTTEGFFKKVGPMLDAEGINFTFHWGQWADLSPGRVTQAFEGNETTWLEQRRKLLPTAKGRRMFSNAMLERCGLHE
ncbi:MAG: FAD-binding protein [Labilithrix sp.]|nr:FAD-binding protein [Labilithrix sp.]